VAAIGDSSIASRGELILSLCWIGECSVYLYCSSPLLNDDLLVGEYANPALCSACTNEGGLNIRSISYAQSDKSQLVLNDYHEALELFAYERMFVLFFFFFTVFFCSQLSNRSLVKLEGSDMYFGSGPKVEQKLSKNGFDLFTTRLMLVVISSLAKLAARWQDLASRVLLCLAKIMRHQHYFDPIVLIRANECMQLLKFPRWAFFCNSLFDNTILNATARCLSIAPSILGSPYQSLEKRVTHIDESSSLPFILHPSIPFVSGESLHPWTLYWIQSDIFVDNIYH